MHYKAHLRHWTLQPLPCSVNGLLMEPTVNPMKLTEYSSNHEYTLDHYRPLKHFAKPRISYSRCNSTGDLYKVVAIANY